MQKQNRSFAVLLWVVAALVFVIATSLVALPDSIRQKLDPRMLAWIALPLAVAASLALASLAALIKREAVAPPEVTSALSRIQQQLLDLNQKVIDLQTMSDRAASRHAHAAPTTTSTAPTKDLASQLQHLHEAIQEIREISLLPDNDRRQRLQVHRQQKKATLIKELFGLVAAHDWSQAERMLISLETEYPNDDEVAKGRSYLNHSRKLFEQETVGRESAEIENLVAAANWDKAYERARHLMDGFPESGEVRALLSRVERERSTFDETTVARLFDDIRDDIDHRSWRPALEKSRHLLERFPTHRLAERVRAQLKTLQDNAEIEERQELEVRIQELARSGQLDQAIDLAEDLIRRYPMSPQAESLEILLPRMREMARQGVAEFEGLGVTDDAGAAAVDLDLDIVPPDDVRRRPPSSGQTGSPFRT